MFMSTPVWREQLQLDIVDVGDAAATEFNETPIFRESFLFSKLKNFVCEIAGEQVEIRVGEFVSAEDQIVRVERLFFDESYIHVCQSEHVDPKELNSTDMIPELQFEGTVFRQGDNPNEVELTRIKQTFPVSSITAKISIVGASNSDSCVGHTNSYWCRKADGRPFGYIPWVPAMTFREVLLGLPFLWYIIFVDKYVSTEGRSESTEAIYMAIVNVHSSLLDGPLLVFVLMLLPPRCSLPDAMKVVNRDLLVLEKQGVICYDVKTNKNIILRCACAGLICDHVQGCIWCRHLGNAAKRNSRDCFRSFTDDPNHTQNCSSHTHQRRNEQTDVIVKMLCAFSKKAKNATKLDLFRQHFGVRNTSFLLDGLSVDPHTMAYFCPSHFLWYGLLRLIVTAMLKDMSPAQRTTFQINLRDFPWPPGCNPPVLNTKSKFGTGVTMTMWRMIGVACQHCLEGLVPRAKLVYLCSVIRWSVIVLGPVSVAQIKVATTRARAICTLGTKLFPEMKKKPNTHILVSFVTFTLQALRNGQLARSDRFEMVNGISKGSARGSRGGQGGSGGERISLRRSAGAHALRSCFAGLKWGSNGQYGFRQALLEKKDYRSHRAHRPHPMIARLLSFIVSDRGNDLQGAGPWDLYELDRVKAWSKHKTNLLITSFEQVYGMKVATADLELVTFVRSIVEPSRHLITRGDTVCALVNGEEQYCNVDGLLVVAVNGVKYAWVFPRFFTKTKEYHETRLTLQVDAPFPEEIGKPLPFSVILRQVLLVHSCLQPGHQACAVVGGRLAHTTSNRTHEIFDRPNGFLSSKLSWYVHETLLLHFCINLFSFFVFC